MRVGYDIDDVLFPWYQRAHRHVMRAGLHNGVTPKSWRPHEEYNIPLEEWLAVLDRGTLRGTLTGRGRPIPGSIKEIRRVKEAGHTVVLVTARGFFKHGHRIKAQTKHWLKTWKVPYDELYFTKDKTVVPLDTMVDDNLANYDALHAHGVHTFLLNRTWNLPWNDDRNRIDHLYEYTDAVLEMSSAGSSA